MSLGNGYVLIADLTDEYIQELITRNGYTDVTQPDSYYPYSIQDTDSNIDNFGSIQQARDWLITRYLIVQNS